MTDMTTAQMLADAIAALHKLKLGRLAVEVQVDGRRLRYAHTDIDKLEGYVAYLQNLVNGVCSRPGAIGFYL